MCRGCSRDKGRPLVLGLWAEALACAWLRHHSPPFPAGLAPSPALDGKGYRSILYGNGPGFPISGASRTNVSDSKSR